jgi:hypothetical protein
MVPATEAVKVAKGRQVSIETHLPPTVEVPRGGKLRAVGYVRQSMEEVHKGLRSAESQRANIRSYAEANGWELVEIYEDIPYSGDDLVRPALLELLSRLDFDVLLVDTAERLTRKKKDLDLIMALLAKRNITCVGATWSWDFVSQYMRHCYRLQGNPLYAHCDACVV